MGGHGGLNILPQKRWNVYNFENRERVRKDEEEASRQEQAEQHKAQARDAEFRMEKLREAARLKKQQESHVRNKSEKLDAIPEEASGVAVLVASVDQDAERPQHINLFAELEAKERDAETKFSERRNCSRKDKGDGLEKKGDERGKRTRKGKDEDALKADENERYRLGHGSYGKSGKRPWYMAKSSLLEDEDAGVQRQNIPSANENAEKRKKTVEELRAERIKREEQERERASRLVSPTAGGPRRPNGFQNYSHARRSHFQYNSGYGNSW